MRRFGFRCGGAGGGHALRFVRRGADFETEKTGRGTVQFPATWVNSDPISLESLRGKAVFLYFFEETCPKCRDRWPSLILKIAANTRTSRSSSWR